MVGLEVLVTHLAQTQLGVASLALVVLKASDAVETFLAGDARERLQRRLDIFFGWFFLGLLALSFRIGRLFFPLSLIVHRAAVHLRAPWLGLLAGSGLGLVRPRLGLLGEAASHRSVGWSLKLAARGLNEGH